MSARNTGAKSELTVRTPHISQVKQMFMFFLCLNNRKSSLGIVHRLTGLADHPYPTDRLIEAYSPTFCTKRLT